MKPTPGSRVPGIRRLGAFVFLAITPWVGAATPQNPPPWHGAPPPDYVVRRVSSPSPATPSLRAAWQGAEWSHAQTLQVDRFHDKPDPLYPKTQARLLHDERGIHVFFRVEDRYVRSAPAGLGTNVARQLLQDFAR